MTWTAPTTRITGELITASIWNTDLVDNLESLRDDIVYFQIVVFGLTQTALTGDSKAKIIIPADINGMNLVSVNANAETAGTTGTMDIQINNAIQAVDMLSTLLTIDSGETSSKDAAVPAVIDTDNDNVATDDELYVDVDAVQTTPAEGLIVTLGFQHPQEIICHA